MTRLFIFGLGLLLLAGCTDPIEKPVIPADSNEPGPEIMSEWTREDFKDVFDQHEVAEKLLETLEANGLTPYRETFERVVITGNGIHHTYADVYPFQLDDGTYATVYEDEDGWIANGTEANAPLFWQETSFLQFVEEIEKRKYGTSAPPEDVTLTQDAFQSIYDRHAYTSALIVELDEWGVSIAREPLEDVIIAGDGVTEVTADLIVFEVESGYAIVYDRDGEIFKGPESIAPLFWNETDYKHLLEKNE
ncbi:hypothetical protein [Exiguobacterium sp. AB2]|uniref:hypothetical protein n=1 Tax=Exiguobacterium sp. AB2 TaxID=1484479 RepID=UPI0004A8DA66|nr:hypothetical protein [Exiguobacterium sp. AB2]KDN57816.1 hypothetical protein DI14_13180 [Exiguobacterium sp. AB2]